MTTASTASGAAPTPTADGHGARGPHRSFWIGAIVVTVVLAAIVSFYASSSPDGLEKVATDEGFAVTARDHDLADSPLADYGVEGIDDDRASVGVAGVVGVAVTLAVAGGLFWLVRRRGDSDTEDSDDPAVLVAGGPATTTADEPEG